MHQGYPSPDRFLTLMQEAAAEHILPRFGALDAADIAEKEGPEDLVTVADREAEEALTPALKALMPGCEVVGEEAVADDPSRLTLLHGDKPVWLVDPVDGTANFVAGSDRFGVMVALVHRQDVQAAAILYPVSGDHILAERGAGAFFNAERLAAPKPAPFAEAEGDYSHSYVEEPYRSAFLRATAKAGPVRRGRCSAYAYGDLARGLIDYVIQYRMTPWDHAPGQLIVEEAGGRFGFLPSGAPYTPVARADRPMLATASKTAFFAYSEPLCAEGIGIAAERT